jgi:hypothetical protein
MAGRLFFLGNKKPKKKKDMQKLEEKMCDVSLPIITEMKSRKCNGQMERFQINPRRKTNENPSFENIR